MANETPQDALSPVRPPKEATRLKRIAMLQGAEDALALRKMGASYPEIAKALKVSKATAWRYVQHGIKHAMQEPGEAVIRLELDRLDAMLSAIWPKVRDGDLAAVDRVLRIMERRARYLNLDSPFREELLEVEARRLATLYGLDEKELVKEAEEVIKASRG